MKKFIPALSFNFLTGYYDWVIDKVMPEGFREILVNQIDLNKNDIILDFGTGTAELAILLKRKENSTTIIALDIDPKVLEIAGKKIAGYNLDIRTLRYDGTTVPFLSAHFTKVVSCLVFHHLDAGQKQRALSEIYRVLKNGGRLYISDWGLERNKTKAKFLRLFRFSRSLRNIEEHGKGLFPGYITKAGFRNVVETSFLKTRTGTLCYYQAEK